MPLHNKNDIRDEWRDDVYGTSDVSRPLPKYRMPEQEQEASLASSIVRDELMLDGNARQNLATFCQTWLDDEIHKIMDLCIDKNMIDKDEYPQTAEIEARCVHMLADLWNAPDGTNTLGTSTTGSSDAAMLGGLAAKWRWREKRKAEGKPTDKPNLVCGPVQVCWHKFAKYWDIELREIPLEGDRLIMNAEEVLKRVDENTICVVPTFGVTFTCNYEPVQEVSDALDKLQEETGLDVPIHVDAASGGFLAPFCAPDIVWDFRLPRVKSINASGHKFGLAPLGTGWCIFRDASDLPDDLIFWVNYLGGNMPTLALSFSRPGGQIIAQYYNFLRLGREGYRKIHSACYDTAQYLAEEIGKMGPFEILYDGQPEDGIPALSWTVKEGFDTRGYTLFDLSDRLRMRGWQVAAYTMPPKREDLVVQRILVRHGFTKDLASLFIEDMKNCLKFFKAHPVSTPLTEAEAGGFHH
ncbi:glutamate decarboxylase [Stappia sp.]|jgi:glutamate decarboxylase|uniref:glutamate decarboxylase n=1 Tax=Stappia sp. TaxID=1870903 RepID=UPI003A990A37